METRLRLTLVFSILIFILIIISFIKKDNINIKYSLVWLASGLIMIIVILIPNFLEVISKVLGFKLVSNMIFMLAIIVLYIISFLFTVIASRQTKKIKLLIQELSLLKSRVEELEINEKK